MTIARLHLATTAFATIVTALVLSSQPGQVRAELAPVAAPVTAAVVHQLPRVVVTGQVQRAQAAHVVELPRVVVTARRADAAQTLVVQAPVRSAGARS